MAELTEDFLAPMVRFLRDSPEVADFHNLIPDNGVNPVLGPPTNVLDKDEGYKPYSGGRSLWIFRGFDSNGEPNANVEGTGSSAITLVEGPAWSRKNRGGSLSFLTLTVYYHCDVTRDEVLGSPIAYDARSKCVSLHKAVSKLLNVRHKGTGGFLNWGTNPDGSGGLKVVTSVAGSELAISPVLNGDGLVEGRATFEMEVLL